MAIQRRTAPGRGHTSLADKLLQTGDGRDALGTLPSPGDVAMLVEDILAVLFPGWGRSGAATAPPLAELRDHVAGVLTRLEARLEEAVFLGLHRRCPPEQSEEVCRGRAVRITRRAMAALPSIRALLLKDVAAAFEADPAATGEDEIIVCYPGLYAVAVFRVANRLLREGSVVLPRMLTEHAKARTGIDIHPGATIGPSFFIDHGTGIVIGETTVIGASVRIYQGVTLGALSVRRRDSQGQAPPGKRHPTIEDNVIIYANATILGGTTVIGRGAIIGGNAWITYSVPPGTRVGVG